MGLQKTKGNGQYAPLSARYYEDPDVIDAGSDAELLFIRSLSFCSQSDSDGFVTETEVRNLLGRGLRRMDQRVAALVRTGLWSPISGGYVIRAWLKWNKSTDEIGRYLKRDRERKADNSARNPVGGRADSSYQGTTQHYRSLQGTALLVEIEGEGTSPVAGDGPKPSPCSKHPKGPHHDEPCHDCAQWAKDLAAIAKADELGAKRAKAEATKVRETCNQCAGSGWVLDTDPAVRCTHRVAVS